MAKVTPYGGKGKLKSPKKKKITFFVKRNGKNKKISFMARK